MVPILNHVCGLKCIPMTVLDCAIGQQSMPMHTLCFLCKGHLKSQPPASILDIGQVTYAKSHSDWMIEGPFALAAARFVPACGFAKPAGRFLCLGFSYTTRADCWRRVIRWNEGETRCVHMSIKENHAWIHEQIGPANPSLYLHAECSEVVSNENWIKTVMFIVAAWVVEVCGVVVS